MTPSEIITEVLGILERPDLRSSAESRFYSALQSAHKIDKFRRDLYTAYIPNPSVVQAQELGRVTYFVDTVTPRLREIRSIRLYKAFSNPTPDVYIPDESLEVMCSGKFVDISERLAAHDYYGFKYPYTYSSMGNVGVLSGVDTQTTLIQLVYLGFPELTRDPVTEELTSTSWILTHFPQVVGAFLRWHLATIIDSDSLIRSANTELAFQRTEFLQTYVKDILGDV